MTAHADMSLFARPRITMQEREDAPCYGGPSPCRITRARSLRSVWAWAAADPGHPLVAERVGWTDRGAPAVTGLPSLRLGTGQALLERGLAATGRAACAVRQQYRPPGE